MKKLILIGRSGCGKTTLKQALRGENLEHRKTQYIDYSGDIIDTPGEYAEYANLGGALAVYSCEADVIALVISATDHFSLFPPCVAAMATRPVIGIITKCDEIYSVPERAKSWLELAGCKKVFFTSAKENKGIYEILQELI